MIGHRGGYLRGFPSEPRATITNPDCISLLYTVCVFWGKKWPSAANAKSRKTLQPQGQSKRAPAGQTPFLNYKTAAATLTSSVQQLCPQVVALNRHVYDSWTVHGLPSGEEVCELTMARIAALSGAGSFAQAVTTRARSGHDTTLIRESNRESARESLMFSPEIVGFESPSLRHSLQGNSDGDS